MILTHAEAKSLVNANEVDPYQLVQAVEKAVLTKLANKLRDAERYACMKSFEPDMANEIDVALDAAIFGSKAGQK